MLVLTRRANESIVIGDETVITILGIKGSRIQIGVQAPKKVRILRQEVKDRIQEEELTLQDTFRFGLKT